MKTIFLPIYNGIRARNFFRSDTYKELAADSSVRLVIVIPPAKLDFYRSEHRAANVIFEPYELISEPWFGRVLYDFAFNLLDTNTMRYKQWLEYLRSGKRNLGRFVAKRVLNRVLAPIPWTKHIVRFFDRFVPLDPHVVGLLDCYTPDLVIVPDIVFPPDRIFLRAAKRLGYYVIGMIRSWDNLTSKGVIQILPDKLIVYTTTMKQEAMTYAGMREKDLIVTGLPHYDMFFRPSKTTREVFLKKLGIDPAKRVILCAPFFDQYTGSAVVIIKELIRAIETGRLPNDLHIIVRFRPATPDIPDELGVEDSPYVTVTRPCSRYFKVRNLQAPAKDWEFTEEDLDLLMNSLRYSDVVINTISTLSIDAAIFDKPVINVRFDADPNVPPKHSVNLVIQHDHYKAIEDSGGVTLAWNMQELLDAIDRYLKDPSLDHEGRQRMVREQIGIIDDKAGKRVADFIKQTIESLSH